jgi:phosphohistidine phosphatase SixA
MTFHVSPAEREQQTFSALQQRWAGLTPQHAITTRSLYTFDYRAVLGWIAEQSDDAEYLALVGHNPAFTELVKFLGRSRHAGQSTHGGLGRALDPHRWVVAGLMMPRGRGELAYHHFPSLWRTAMETTD